MIVSVVVGEERWHLVVAKLFLTKLDKVICQNTKYNIIAVKL